ncbi:MAG: 23S rRNA (guanosine(2251)-2'-O)-methyltransferase RlmB [Desulfobacterales bacterium]|nr:23S rRNA (guanosine(2251)-2'-O)-methyltransferase RlmB [Desulfobacterales bacterium]
MSEALGAGRRRVHEIFTIKGGKESRLASILVIAAKRKIPVTPLTAPAFQSMSGDHVRHGVGARVGPYPAATLTEILDAPAAREGGSFLLLLDGVVDPQNLGALIRTALCAGVHGVVIPKKRSAQPTPTVSRASAGALEHVRLAMVSNMTAAIKTLNKRGVWVFGLDRGAGQSVFASDLTGPAAIVVGGEEKGIRPLVKKQCDMLMSIPQEGPMDSLNASVAGAVALYEAYRQRRWVDSGC